jgi:hypothetical protein
MQPAINVTAEAKVLCKLNGASKATGRHPLTKGSMVTVLVTVCPMAKSKGICCENVSNELRTVAMLFYSEGPQTVEPFQSTSFPADKHRSST